MQILTRRRGEECLAFIANNPSLFATGDTFVEAILALRRKYMQRMSQRALNNLISNYMGHTGDWCNDLDEAWNAAEAVLGSVAFQQVCITIYGHNIIKVTDGSGLVRGDMELLEEKHSAYCWEKAENPLADALSRLCAKRIMYS